MRRAQKSRQHTTAGTNHCLPQALGELVDDEPLLTLPSAIAHPLPTLGWEYDRHDPARPWEDERHDLTSVLNSAPATAAPPGPAAPLFAHSAEATGATGAAGQTLGGGQPLWEDDRQDPARPWEDDRHDLGYLL